MRGDTYGDLVLREATDADVPIIVAVVRSAFDEYRGKLDPPSYLRKFLWWDIVNPGEKL